MFLWEFKEATWCGIPRRQTSEMNNSRTGAALLLNQSLLHDYRGMLSPCNYGQFPNDLGIHPSFGLVPSWFFLEMQVEALLVCDLG